MVGHRAATSRRVGVPCLFIRVSGETDTMSWKRVGAGTGYDAGWFAIVVTAVVRASIMNWFRVPERARRLFLKDTGIRTQAP